MESKPVADRFVGIDVSKSWVDVHVRPDGIAFRCGTDAEGLAELVRRLKPLAPALAAMEASGGYESVVAVSLAEAGLPVAIINPRQVRKFAQALGKLAKTDAIDAAVIAHFAEAVRPPARELPDQSLAQLQELLGRRRRKVEQRGIVNRLEARLHGIAEADIDHDGNACARERSRAAQSDATILQFLADESDPQRVEIESDAIIAGNRQHLAENAEDALLAGIAKSQEVKVSRAAGCLRQPDDEQHGALQDKAVSVRRAAQSVEQALVNEARQEDVERLVGLPREIEQARPDGCGDVCRRLSHRR